MPTHATFKTKGISTNPAKERIIYSVPSLAADTGGPARSVTGLADAISRHSYQITLATLNIKSFSDIWITPAASDSEVVEIVELATITSRLASQLWSYKIGKKISQLVLEKEVKLIHDNGVWQPFNVHVAIAAKRTITPLIISTRGMLEPWALQHKRLQKTAMWSLYQKQILHFAHTLHATSETEATNLRRLGLTQPIAVIPNAVDMPFKPDITTDKPQGKERTLLFMSRLHPKKGLLTLVKAAQHVDLSDWKIIIAGPDEDRHAAEVKATIQKAGLQHLFSFIGPVDDNKKWAIYRQADLFVLPSFSENFGIVVAEALAAGIPVITTKGCPWRDLEIHNCGWWVDIGVEPLVQALRRAISLSTTERYQMGQNGTKLIREKYSWDSAAEKMSTVYQWMLKQGPKPDCII